MRFLLLLAALFCSGVRADTQFPLAGLWWNPADPGWGVSIHQHGDIAFGLLLVYGEDRIAQWYVAPRMECAPVDGDDACKGTLYSATGPAFEPYDPFDSTRVQLRPVGDIDLTAMVGVYGYVRYSIEGRGEGSAVQPLLPYGRSTVFSGLWIDPAEPGWGISIQHRDDLMFVTVLAYDAHGTARWYVAPRVERRWGIGDEDVWYAGRLYLAARPEAAKVDLRQVGDMFLSIMGADGGVDFSIDGMRVDRPITPLRF